MLAALHIVSFDLVASLAVVGLLLAKVLKLTPLNFGQFFAFPLQRDPPLKHLSRLKLRTALLLLIQELVE